MAIRQGYLLLALGRMRLESQYGTPEYEHARSKCEDEEEQTGVTALGTNEEKTIVHGGETKQHTRGRINCNKARTRYRYEEV